VSHRYGSKPQRTALREIRDMKLHSLQKKIIAGRGCGRFPARETKRNSRASLRDRAHVSLPAIDYSSPSLLGAIIFKFRINYM
jgi:hypothetical protein